MNPDHSSDIRQVQRFIMDTNLYLLTMFDKKIPNFNSSMNWQNKERRLQNWHDNLSDKVSIDPDNFVSDPIKNLSKDLTKPFWNCVTRVDPTIVYRRDTEKEALGMINDIGRVLHKYFVRFRKEHEDEGSLKINLHLMDYDKEERELQKLYNSPTNNNNSIYASIQDSTRQLFNLLLTVVDRQLDPRANSNGDEMEQEQEQGQIDPKNWSALYDRKLLLSVKEILTRYLSCSDENFNNQLDIFCKCVITNLNDIVMCKIGSLVLCPMPQIKTLPLFVHPMLLALHGLYRGQVEEIAKKEELKNKNGGNGSPGHGMKKDKNQAKVIFGEMSKNQSLSKIVFLNLDGYESQFNVDITKYLCRSLMYISFPRESNSQYDGVQNQETKQIEDRKSQRLLRKYYFGGLSDDEKRQLLERYKLPEKELKKNLYMFPLHSRKLAEMANLPTIYNHESAFINFIMKQLLISQIIQFNPSLIVVSYTQKIRIENQFFVEIMKQITTNSNYKVVFYANFSKNYLFQQFYQAERQVLDFQKRQQDYFNQHQASMKVVSQNFRINTDMLEKISAMLKISSGTFTLSPSTEIDSYNMKYKNYKAMSFGGPLIDRLWPEMSNLSRLKMRFNEYKSIARVLEGYFNAKGDNFDKLFSKVISKYYINLMKEVQGILNNNQQTISMQMITQGKDIDEEEIARRKAVYAEIKQIKKSLDKNYSEIQIKQRYRNIKFQKYLQISTEKVQSKFYVHIPRFDSGGKIAKKQAQNLICLQFYTVLQKQKIPVQLSPSTSKIHYSSTRRHKNSCIYITNHIIKPTSSQYSHLCGIITEEFDVKVAPKVLLYPVEFRGGPVLQPAYETYCEFNYFETNDYIFMFWPKIHDGRLQLLSRISNTQYTPKQTSLFFCAPRKNPHTLHLLPTGAPNSPILPRSGCQCYEVPHTNSIYIFGGFYSNENNYLLFQTDVTRLQYENIEYSLLPTIRVDNVPKEFYFEAVETKGDSDIMQINKIRNDVVRPRVEYEFVECDKLDEEMGTKTVFLVGGIGQKFVRPYSMIGYMAHKVVFDAKTGNLLSTRRISMNNVIPINTHSPIKMRCPMQAKIISHAQNRSINFISGECGANSFSISYNNIRFNPENQRFEYETEYQFCDSELRNYRQEISTLRKHIAQNKVRLGIYAKTPRGKYHHTNYLTLTSQTPIKYIVELQLCLSTDVLNTHQSLPANVRLTGSSILSIDVNSGIVYALIRHPMYTLDQCILAYFDLNDLGGRLKDAKPIEVHLRQLHKFDENVGYCVLIAANATTVLLLHGQKFVKDAEIEELVLRRNKKSHLRMDKILSNEYSSSVQTSNSSLTENSTVSDNTISISNYADISIVGGLSCSMFLNQNNGTILCFSFKTVQRIPDTDTDIVVFCLERLGLYSSGDKFGWERDKQGQYSFVYDGFGGGSTINGMGNNNSKIKNKRRQNLKLLEIKEWRQSNEGMARKNIYEIIGYVKDELVSGILDTQSSNRTIIFKPLRKNLSQYFKQISINVDRKSSVLLEKSIEGYNEFQLVPGPIQTKFEQMAIE